MKHPDTGECLHLWAFRRRILLAQLHHVRLVRRGVTLRVRPDRLGRRP